MRTKIALAALVTATSVVLAGEPPPRPVPQTRPEIKQQLEDLKGRKPRIPLPELTAEEKERLGERGGSYESRLRTLYLPAGEGGFSGAGNRGGAGGAGSGAPGAGGGGFTRERDPNMTLDNTFKTMLFWIVSRANNCHY